MKMIRAILRPEVTDDVADALTNAGFISMTKMNVFGRGRQQGISFGSVHYDEIPKTMVLMVLPDEHVEQVLGIIRAKSYSGNFGDGKVFISDVESTYTVRTGVKES